MSEDWGWARLIDWEKAFYGDPEPEIEWIAEPFIERGTVNSVYSEVKSGKSLLAQDICAALASGRSVLGYPPAAPVPVLYLDFENSLELITERYRAMGYQAADLKLLHYASYPELPMLDTPEGGEAACRLAHLTGAHLAVVDTTSRIIGGAESSADTFADLYKHTLMRLKRGGCASLRLDHEGKDPARGARGSSAKGADVDVAWHLVREPGDILRLHPEYDRARHVQGFRVAIRPGPLRHEIIRSELSGPQLALAEALDWLGVPRTASRAVCGKAIRSTGYTARTEDLAAVVKHRKTSSGFLDGQPGLTNHVGTAPTGLSPGTAAGTVGQTRPDLLGQGLGQTGQPTWDNSPPRRGGLSQSQADGANPTTEEWASWYEQSRPRRRKPEDS